MSLEESKPTEISPPSHAGGVVRRERPGGTTELLLVTARGEAEHWVLPKGHIEAGESPEAAAVREVEEETGVVAQVTDLLSDVDVELPRGRARIRYFLMELVRDGDPGEGRRAMWCGPERAIEALTFADAKEIVCLAVSKLASREPPR